MATQYPIGIDTTGTLPYVVDGVSPVVAADVNRLRDTLVAIESELGASPSGVNTTVADRMTALESTLTSFAPENATYLVLSTNVSLSNERLMVVGSGLVAIDGGAGGNFTFELDESGVVAGTYIGATVVVDGYGRVVSASDGGVGTLIPGGIAGSVLFVDSGGILAQDGYNFVWDNINNYLGIGTATPGSLLTLAVDGSAANPVISFGNIADPDTGIWHPAADTLAFSANAVEVLRLESTAITLFADVTFDNTVGHTISVEDSVGSSGQSLTIYGGNAPVSATASSQSGGSVSLYAGDGANGIDPSIGGTGGFVQILSGDGGDGWGAVAGQNAGGFNVIGGSGGSGGVSAAGGPGGHMQVTLGNGGVAGTTSGNGGSGGTFTLQTGVGGNASPVGGTGVGGSGGTITLSTGQGGSTSSTGNAGASGSVVLAPAAGRPAIGARLGGAAGDITLTPGTGGSGGTTAPGVNAGTFVVTAATGGVAGTVSGNGGSGSSLTLNGGDGGAANTGTGTAGAGGFVTLRGGQGGTASSTAAGGAGGQMAIVGGIGGSASAASGVPGAGGATYVSGGAGGQGGAGHPAAAGGNVFINGGSAGFDIGTGFNNGGNVTITGGGPSPFSAGLNGSIDIGGTLTSSVSIGSASVTTTILGGVQTVAGSAAAPTYSFISANDGMFHYNDGFGDHLGFSVDGVETASIDIAGIKNLDGSNAAPSYAFSSDADTGMFLLSANVLGLSAGGTGLMYLSGGVVQGYGASSFQLYSGAPSAASPAYAFVSDTNTGIYNNTADELATSTGGASCRFVNRIVSTTDATATAIWTMPTTSDNTYLVEYLVVARSDGLTINSASYHGTILARNNTGTLILYQNPIWIIEDEPAWSFAGVVSGSNLSMTVSGDVGVSINWAGTFRIISVASP